MRAAVAPGKLDNFGPGWLKLSYAQLSVVAVCLVLTVVGSVYSINLERTRAEDAFDFLTSDALGELDEKMATYVKALDSGAALFSVVDNVDRQQWRSFAETLDLETTMPGILGLVYAVPVDREAIDQFLEQAKRDGVENLTIHPKTTEGQLYVIKYIEPYEPNREAVGLNLAFETGRRTAANLARDTGKPQITQRIILVQDNTKKPGFVLLRPLYRNGAPISTVEQRRAAFIGWVCAPFIGASTLDGLTINQGVNYEIAVHEGETYSPENLIFESAEVDPSSASFVQEETVDVFGKTWSIRWMSTPAFEAKHKSIAPTIILLSGLVVTFLIVCYFNTVQRREKQISRQVARKTRELSSLQDETRSVWENAVVPIIVLNDAGQIVSDNPAARMLLGAQGSERHAIIANRLALRIDKGRSQSQRSLVAVVLEDDYLLLDVQCNRWTAPNGDGRTTMIVQNVTEEREATRRIEETEQRWNLALEGARIGVFDVNLKTNTSMVSQTWRDLMRVPHGFSGNTQQLFLSRVHPDDISKIKANDAACMRGDTDRSVTEYRIKFGKDDWCWMRSDAVVVERDEDGTAVRLIGIQTDITDIRSAQDALEASRSRFRLLVENAPVGMAILDPDGVFRGSNAALCDLVGYSQKELLHKQRLADFISYEDLVGILKSIGSKSANRAQAYQAEHLIRHKDGSEIWGLLSISWTFDPAEQTDIFIVQVQDITEKKNIEKLKNSFVATVSHELRTPLTSIKGALGLVEAKTKDSENAPHRRLIQIAHKNTDRLIELVNDILDFEGIMAGEMEFNYVELDLLSSIREAAKLIQPYAENHSARITLDLPETPIRIRGDEVRLAQVLSNLMSNACKFSAQDGDVRIRAELEDGQAIVYVQDDGEGVPSSFHSRIFQPFSQADSSDTRMKGGTGLGLSITKQIIERMGGKIGFENPRKGLTIFWFSLPIISREPLILHPAVSATHDTDAIDVLHIENDLDFAEVFNSNFDERVRITLAESLARARECLRKAKYHVIIIDWNLPDGNASVLLDEIELLQPQAAIMSLSADHAAKPDDRVLHDLVKSKQDLNQIVETIEKSFICA